MSSSHAHIPTPSWRRLQCQPPIAAPHNHSLLSDVDDDTSDEAYVIAHDAAAEAERAHWEGLINKKNANSSASAYTPKRNRVQNPVFPSAKACWHLVREADRRFRASSSAPRKRTPRPKPLAEPLRALARLNNAFVSELSALSAFRSGARLDTPPRSPPVLVNGVCTAPNGDFEEENYDAGMPGDEGWPSIDSLVPQQALQSHQQTPLPVRRGRPLKKSHAKKRERSPRRDQEGIVEQVLRECVAAEIEHARKAFTERTEKLRKAFSDLLAQTGASITGDSFRELLSALGEAERADMKRRKRKGRSSDLEEELDEKNYDTLADAIRDSLDPELYPMVASSLCMPDDYGLEGTHESRRTTSRAPGKSFTNGERRSSKSKRDPLKLVIPMDKTMRGDFLHPEGFLFDFRALKEHCVQEQRQQPQQQYTATHSKAETGTTPLLPVQAENKRERLNLAEVTNRNLGILIPNTRIQDVESYCPPQRKVRRRSWSGSGRPPIPRRGEHDSDGELHLMLTPASGSASASGASTPLTLTKLDGEGKIPPEDIKYLYPLGAPIIEMPVSVAEHIREHKSPPPYAEHAKPISPRPSLGSHDDNHATGNTTNNNSTVANIVDRPPESLDAVPKDENRILEEPLPPMALSPLWRGNSGSQGAPQANDRMKEGNEQRQTALDPPLPSLADIIEKDGVIELE